MGRRWVVVGAVERELPVLPEVEEEEGEDDFDLELVVAELAGLVVAVDSTYP